MLCLSDHLFDWPIGTHCCLRLENPWDVELTKDRKGITILDLVWMLLDSVTWKCGTSVEVYVYG